MALIHLDANYLIAALRRHDLASELRHTAAGDPINVSAIAWAEFLCGPVAGNEELHARALVDQVETLCDTDARFAARLFNQTGRRLRSLPDCLIAAVALRCRASLATMNVADFSRFERFGLILL